MYLLEYLYQLYMQLKVVKQDNVILCLDQPNKIKKAVRKSKKKSDEEHRVWYVGITRARNNLYKLKAKKKVMHTNYRITQLCKQNGIATFPMGWVAASSSNEGCWFVDPCYIRNNNCHN